MQKGKKKADPSQPLPRFPKSCVITTNIVFVCTTTPYFLSFSFYLLCQMKFLSPSQWSLCA